MPKNRPEYREGGVLSVLRAEGMLNYEIAEIVGVTRSTIGNWEKEDTWPVWALWKLGFSVTLCENPFIEHIEDLTKLRDQINEILGEPSE